MDTNTILITTTIIVVLILIYYYNAQKEHFAQNKSGRSHYTAPQFKKVGRTSSLSNYYSNKKTPQTNNPPVEKHKDDKHYHKHIYNYYGYDYPYDYNYNYYYPDYYYYDYPPTYYIPPPDQILIAPTQPIIQPVITQEVNPQMTTTTINTLGESNMEQTNTSVKNLNGETQ